MWHLHEDGKCWLTVEQARVELSKITGKVAKQNAIKQQITIYVKGFGFSEYHTTWSSHGTVHSVEYLQEHLFYIIADRIRSGKEITKPSIKAPIKKELPVLGMQTIHVRDKLEEDLQHQQDLAN